MIMQRRLCRFTAFLLRDGERLCERAAILADPAIDINKYTRAA